MYERAHPASQRRAPTLSAYMTPVSFFRTWTPRRPPGPRPPRIYTDVNQAHIRVWPGRAPPIAGRGAPAANSTWRTWPKAPRPTRATSSKSRRESCCGLMSTDSSARIHSENCCPSAPTASPPPRKATLASSSSRCYAERHRGPELSGSCARWGMAQATDGLGQGVTSGRVAESSAEVRVRVMYRIQDGVRPGQSRKILVDPSAWKMPKLRSHSQGLSCRRREPPMILRLARPNSILSNVGTYQ